MAPGAAHKGWGGGFVERRLRSQERESHSKGPSARGPGTQPRIRPPPGQAEAWRAQDSKDVPAQS